MKYAPFIVALIVSLLLAYLFDEDMFGFIAFAMAGALGGLIAARMPPGSEGLYWGFVLVTLVVFFTGVTMFDFDPLVIILPLILTVAYFVARVAGRLTGQRGSKLCEASCTGVEPGQNV